MLYVVKSLNWFFLFFKFRLSEPHLRAINRKQKCLITEMNWLEQYEYELEIHTVLRVLLEDCFWFPATYYKFLSTSLLRPFCPDVFSFALIRILLFNKTIKTKPDMIFNNKNVFFFFFAELMFSTLNAELFLTILVTKKVKSIRVYTKCFRTRTRNCTVPYLYHKVCWLQSNEFDRMRWHQFVWMRFLGITYRREYTEKCSCTWKITKINFRWKVHSRKMNGMTVWNVDQSKWKILKKIWTKEIHFLFDKDVCNI